jgi:hypothetical protein
LGSDDQAEVALRAALSSRVLHDKSVEFALTVTNVSESSVQVVLYNGQDFEMLAKKDGDVVYRWSDGMFFTQAIRSVTYDPGEVKRFVWKWSPESPGLYELEVFYLGISRAEPAIRQMYIVDYFVTGKYLDDKTGDYVYLIRESAPDYRLRVLTVNSETGEARELLLDGWYSLWKHEQEIIVYANGRRHVLDLENQMLVEKTHYTMSRDGLFGYTSSNYFTRNMAKNFATGEIRELPAGRYARINGWLGEGELLITQYSENHRQNVMYLYDIRKNELREVFPGTAWATIDGNKIIYVQNELARRFRLLNPDTMVEQIISWNEYLSLVQRPQEQQVSVPDPARIDLIALEQVELGIEREYQHTVKVNGINYPVSYVFWRGEAQYIPVRDLLGPLGITFLMEERGVNNKRFSLTRGEVTVVLTDSDSTVYLERLFVTQNVLTTLGIDVEAINAVQ